MSNRRGSSVKYSDARIPMNQLPCSRIEMASLTLVAIAILAYQTNFVPFFQPLIGAENFVWKIAYYIFWSLVIFSSAAMLVKKSTVRSATSLALLFCALSASLVVLHPIDQVAKNYLVAMGLMACIVILSVGTNARVLAQLSASVTAFNACVCLLDVMFPDGFTSVAGRAAGLSVNPNVAASGLLLGAVATEWSIPSRLRSSFLVLVIGGVFVTLSRSAFLISLVIVAFVSVTSFLPPYRRADIRQALVSVKTSFSVIVLVVVSISAALLLNERFPHAIGMSYGRAMEAKAAFERVAQSVRSLSVTTAPLAADETSVEIREIEERIKSEELVSSISARSLLLQRALLSYKIAPPFGLGLAQAHRLEPHNTYLLFATAFGHIGWLVPVALLILLGRYAVRSSARLPFVIATAALMLFSHDVMLFPSLMIILSVGTAGLIVQAKNYCDDRKYEWKCIGRVVLGAIPVVLIACLAILSNHDRSSTQRISSNDIRSLKSGVYLLEVARPDFSGVYRNADVLSVTENGIQFSSSTVSKILSGTPGLYSKWKNDTLVFTSTNGDPSKREQSYNIKHKLTVHPLFLLLTTVTILWLTVMFLFIRKATTDLQPGAWDKHSQL